MARDQIDMTPIETRDELVAWFAEGEKPPERFRVGTEHEKFAFTLARHEPVPYAGPRGIRALLEGMQVLLGWEPIMEGENIIGLSDVTGGAHSYYEAKYKDPLGIVFDLTHTGWAGAVKDVVAAKN